MDSYRTYLVQMLVTVGLLAAAGIALAWGARRPFAPKRRGPLELVGRLPLDGRRCVYLIQAGPKIFVLAAGEAGFATLGELPEGAIAPGKELPVLDFRAILTGAWKDHRLGAASAPPPSATGAEPPPLGDDLPRPGTPDPLRAGGEDSRGAGRGEAAS